MKQKLLTNLELHVMLRLWQMENAFVKELVERWGESPVPAYNTVSTIVRILQDKGFVGYKAFGRSHQYFPIIQKEEYQKSLMGNILDRAFSGSLTSMVSTLVEDQNISKAELENLRAIIDQKLQ